MHLRLFLSLRIDNTTTLEGLIVLGIETLFNIYSLVLRPATFTTSPCLSVPSRDSRFITLSDRAFQPPYVPQGFRCPSLLAYDHQ